MIKHTLAIILMLSTVNAFADDIEIFKGRRTKDKPNVIFLMDTSASMAFYATLNPSSELPATYDKNIRYPRVLNGYDSDAVYIANGTWFASHDALNKLNDNSGDHYNQRNMQRVKINRSAVQCQEVSDALDNQGFWSYRKPGWPGNLLGQRPYLNKKVKLYSRANGWDSLPRDSHSLALGHLVSLSYIDPEASHQLKCQGENGAPSNWDKFILGVDWDTKYAEKIATGNYLNYISAYNQSQGKFLYSRISILHDAIYNALGKVKGVNIGLARTDGKIRSANLLGDLKQVKGGGITIPLMPIESAQAVFDKEITTYVPNKFNSLTESLYEVMSYLKGGSIKFANDMDYKVVKRTEVLDRFKGTLTFQNMRGNVTNNPSLKDKGYQVPSAIKKNSNTYQMPVVKECTTTDVLLFSDGEDFYDGTIFESNSDVESNQDIVNLIQNLTFPAGSFLYKKCRPDLAVPKPLTNKSYSGQCLDELAYYMSHIDQYPSIGTGTANEKQVIKVHAIGGFLGQNQNNIRYLQHVAKSGKGLFYAADNLVDMRNAIYNAISNTLNVTSTFTAPNVPVSATNRLQDSKDVYLPQFVPQNITNWIGNFKRYKLNDFNQIIDANDNPAINANGFIKKTAKSIWSSVDDGNEVEKGGMASHLEKNRKVWVNYGSTLSKFENSSISDNSKKTWMALKNTFQNNFFADIKKWVRGIIVAPDNSGSTFAKKSMEDIMHSPPLLVSYASADPNKPEQTIFVGSNSGFLHAFNPDKNNPTERYSFIPKSLFKNFKYYFFNEYSWIDKPYGLDGAITSWHQDSNRNGIVDNGEKIYLYVGMRRGGHSYYALDISNKDKPELKWTIHGAYPNGTVNKPSTSTGFSRLGQTWSPLVPAEVMWKGQRKVVLFAGGGYNTKEDGTTDTGPATRISYNVGNTVYMIDADNGEVLWNAKAHLQGNSADEMKNSFVAKPVPVDTTGNGTVDMLYATDVGGRVWRFDMKKPNQSSTNANNFADGGVIADINDGSEQGNRRFFAEPDISYFKGKSKPILISVGSGYRAHPLSEKVQNQHFLIKDVLNKPSSYHTLNIADLKPLETKEVSSITQNTTTASNANAIDSNVPNGWYIPLVSNSKGEKVLSATTTVKGQIFISTYSPEETTGASNVANCIPKYGQTRLYNVDMFSIGKKKVLVKKLKQSGIPSQPVVLFNRKAKPGTGGGTGGTGSSGGGTSGITNTNNCENIGAVTMIGTEVVENSLNRCGQIKPIYWREL